LSIKSIEEDEEENKRSTSRKKFIVKITTPMPPMVQYLKDK